MRGLFLVLEGGEGAGKTTLARSLTERLTGAGRGVVLTREPGGTPFGEAMRGVLQSDGLVAWAETFAFLAARAQLVDTVIRPALAEGKAVVCDRFSASTFAYQGHGRGLDLTRLRVANAIATGGLVPDLTILLDLPPVEGLARKHGELDPVRTGAEPPEFHERVRGGYRALALEAPPGTWVTLDATERPERVLESAWSVIAPRVAPRRFAELD